MKIEDGNTGGCEGGAMEVIIVDGKDIGTVLSSDVTNGTVVTAADEVDEQSRPIASPRFDPDPWHAEESSALGPLETIQEGVVLEIELEKPPMSPSSERSCNSPAKLPSGSPFIKKGSLSQPRFYFEDNVSESDVPRPSASYGDGGGGEDDDASITSLPAELPPPPDGGWGWVVVFVSFLANMVVDGTAYSFSPFLDEFSSYFREPQGKVAWISSLLAGVYLSAGPIVSALVNKFGCRRVCIVGGVIASASYASTVFATSVEYLMITQGVCAGLGFGLIYLPAVVCVGYYFESKRAMATGIAVCGSGVGTMLFPPMANYLISQFGWKGTNLLIAGIVLNCCVFGAMMRPLEVPRMRRKDLMYRLAEEKRLAQEVGSTCGSAYFSVTLPDGTTERHLKHPVNADPGVHSSLNLSGFFSPNPTLAPLPPIQETHGSTPPDNDSPIALAHSGDKSAVPQSPSSDSDTKALVATKLPRVAPAKMPRNSSQPAMAPEGARNVRKNPSVPNFERRMSKVEALNQMKLIPATPRASVVNLKALGSQDMRRNSTYSTSDPEYAYVLRSRRSSKEKPPLMLRPMSRQDIFFSGSIQNLREFKSQASMLSYRESTLNLQGTGASRTVTDALDGMDLSEEKVCCNCLPESIRGTLSEMMDCSLLRNPVFLFIGIANIFGMLGFYTPFVYLPSAAVEKGVDKESATFLISIIGITNTLSRVITGCMADLPCVNALWVNNMSLLFSAVCVFLIPFATSYSSFVVLAIFFGFFVAPFIALTSIILVDLLGLRQLTNAFGLLCIFRGIAGILGPPVSGSIYDATQSYDVSFYVAGGLLFLSSMMHCMVPFIQRVWAHDSVPVKYTTNEEYLAAVPEESESEDDELSPREGTGIILDIKPKGAWGSGEGGNGDHRGRGRHSVSSAL